MACTNCEQQTTPCVSTPSCSEVCVDNVRTKCVTSSEDVGTPLNVETGETLDSIIRKINVLIAAASPGSYADYEYGCLASQNIESEEQFVEKVVNIICQILGTQVPGGITSLSSLNAFIQQLLTDVGLIKTQNVVGCYATLASLPSSTTLTNLLSSIQQILCNHASFISTFSSPNISVNNTNKSVIITAAGTQNHTLSADVSIQSDPNQALVKNADGTLFVPKETPIQINPHPTTTVSASGTNNHTLQVAAKISPNAGNQLLNDGAGLYVPAPSLSETPLVANDSSTIDFSQGGVNGHTISAAVKVDPSPNNLIAVTGSGIFVDSSTIPSATETPLTAIDSQSIDFSTSGINNHTLNASVKINPSTNNPIFIAPNGLDFDDVKAITRIVNNSTAMALLCAAVVSCAMPSVVLNCGSATIPSFQVGTATSGTLTIPVTITNSGNITISAIGNGISGSNVIAVTPATTSLSVNLNYDGLGTSGNRSVIVTIAGAANAASCNVNVPVAPSSNVEIQSSLGGTSLTVVSNISGFVLPQSVEPGETVSGSHTGGAYAVSCTVTGPPAIDGNIILKRNGIALQTIALTTGDSYPKAVNFTSQNFVVTDLLEIDLNTGL